MNELEAILTAYHSQSYPAQARPAALFLATVVATAGSTYRRPGARLLLTPDGELAGLISGGCLENDIVQHLRQRSQTLIDQPFVITYDLTADEDILWGFGLGCNGIARILVESLNRTSGQQLMTFLTQCWQQRQTGVLATVIDSAGVESNLVQIGDRLMLQNQMLQNQMIQSTLPHELLVPLIADAQTAKDTAQPYAAQSYATVRRYAWAAGWVEVCLEVIRPPVSLLVFGAGGDAVPVVALAKQLGWHVTVVDCRALEATPARFAIADRVILARRESLDQQIRLDSDTVALVMTHHYEDDQAILRFLFNAAPLYIGLLGSRQRTQRILQDYEQTNGAISAEQQQRLHAPVGLDIGAETPAEIALAALAEIQAVLTQRQAGSLKHQPGSIHTRSDRHRA